MHPVHQTTYHVAKAEEAVRLARLEQRRMLADAAHEAESRAPQTHTIMHRASRRIALAAATGALLLGLVAGVAVASEQAAPGTGGGCGGGHAVKLLC